MQQHAAFVCGNVRILEKPGSFPGAGVRWQLSILNGTPRASLCTDRKERMPVGYDGSQLGKIHQHRERAGHMTRMERKPIIYAYGFDKLKVRTPTQRLEHKTFDLLFVDYSSSVSLAAADGILVPSGIFEEFYVPNHPLGVRNRRVRFDEELLATREKQLLNSTRDGAWVAFLLASVDVSDGARDTDLAKKFLNPLVANVEVLKPHPDVLCKTDEFRAYLAKFGIARTAVRLTNDERSRVLAEAAHYQVGFEHSGQFFFLPFSLPTQDADGITEAIRSATNAVLDYRIRNSVRIPPWVTAMRFKSELQIQMDIKDAEARLDKLHNESSRWQRYKAILCTSGNDLNKIVVEILCGFFGLKTRSEEKYVEDAMILSPDDKPICVVEIKGTKAGVKREYINQVDSHRERLQVDPEVPGLLIINDFMDIPDFEKRKSCPVDANHLNHAKNLNIKILRTVSLFEIMIKLEEAPQRQDEFLSLFHKASPILAWSELPT